LLSCTGKKEQFDATGTFEAREVIVSSEAAGIIREFNINEGDLVQKGQLAGNIDSIQLYLKRKQLLAQIKALLSKSPDVNTQLAAAEEQLHHARQEKIRTEKLLKDNAATQKQMDDINSQIIVLEKQVQAARSSLGITVNGLNQETNPINIQIEQLNDQISRCRIVSPVKGSVLTKYAEAGELAAPGKPLFKVADLSVLTLRAYITGDQLQKIKIGQRVRIFTDNGKDSYAEHNGVVEWINDKAEFTPKTIQTKDERANLVYAVKIRVNNNGALKLGMYGEVKL
jgi:HlyD family secretion protein